MKPKLLSKCCLATAKVINGCDSDTGHGGKPCDCEVSTCYWVCLYCGKPCDLYHEPKTKLPEKIDISVIRGQWLVYSSQAYPISGGDDTEKSIKLVAEKVNQLISYIESKEHGE